MNIEPVSKEALRVAFVTADAGMGGAEKQLFYMARALAAAGVAVRVYNLRPGGGFYENALRQCRIECTVIRRAPLPPARLWFVVKAIRPFRPHVVQSIHAYTNFYAALAGRMLGALTIGGLREALDAHIEHYRAGAGMLLRLPDAVAVNSHRALEEMRTRRMAGADRALHLPNAIDVASIRAGGREAGSCTCMILGRLIPGKRVELFLRALAIARRSDPSIRGLIVGDGPEAPRLKQLAAELDLHGHVTFAGRRQGAADLFAASSISVLCSESEGTPNVLLEAMAAGLPVVTTPAGDAAELVRRAGAGFVVADSDPKAIAARIVELARCGDLRAELGRAGRGYMERHHSTDNLAPVLLAMYDDVARLACERMWARRMRGVAAACAAARSRCEV